MGLLDKLDSVFGGGGSKGEDRSSADDIAEEFEEQVELEGSVEDDIQGDEIEDGAEEKLEWESAYRFAEDMLEDDGHANMMEFTRKVMFDEIKKSPRFRDRIQHGLDTVDQITSAAENIRELKGGGEGTNYGEKAEELEEVNNLMDQIDKLEGKEDQIVREALTTGRRLADSLMENAGNQSGSVDSDVRRREGSIEE